MDTHCSSASEASRSKPIWRSAMLTTVPSSIAIPEPSATVASSTRPRTELSSRSPSSGFLVGVRSTALGGTVDLRTNLLRRVLDVRPLSWPVVDPIDQRSWSTGAFADCCRRMGPERPKRAGGAKVDQFVQ